MPPLIAELRAQGAQRIWIFGSLAEHRFHPDSDLDLAVEGLGPMAPFGLRHRLTLLAGRSVDLVRIEDCPPTLRARILEHGEEII